MSNSGFADLLNGPGKKAHRAPDQFVSTIKESFLNVDIKMQSPDFVKPAVIDYEKETLSGSMENIKVSIAHAIKTSKLTEICAGFELPVLGYLTRLEAINFVISHTRRHIYQLRKIYNEVAKKELKQHF
jgi:hypothetical protein